MDKEDHNEKRDVGRDVARGTTPRMMTLKEQSEGLVADARAAQALQRAFETEGWYGSTVSSVDEYQAAATKQAHLDNVLRAVMRAQGAKAIHMNPHLDHDVGSKVEGHLKRILDSGGWM